MNEILWVVVCRRGKDVTVHEFTDEAEAREQFKAYRKGPAARDGGMGDEDPRSIVLYEAISRDSFALLRVKGG